MLAKDVQIVKTLKPFLKLAKPMGVARGAVKSESEEPLLVRLRLHVFPILGAPRCLRALVAAPIETTNWEGAELLDSFLLLLDVFFMEGTF